MSATADRMMRLMRELDTCIAFFTKNVRDQVKTGTGLKSSPPEELGSFCFRLYFEERLEVNGIAFNGISVSVPVDCAGNKEKKDYTPYVPRTIETLLTLDDELLDSNDNSMKCFDSDSVSDVIDYINNLKNGIDVAT